MKDESQYTYMGERILRCERAPGEHRGRWIIQRYHLASIDGDRDQPYADEVCPHFNTLRDARDAIREEVAQDRWARG